MEDQAKETYDNEEIIEWHKLDERAVTLWKIKEVIGSSFFLIIILAGGTPLSLFTPFPGILFILVILLVIGLFCFNFFWLPHM